MIQPAHLARLMLDDGLAQRDLAVARQDDLPWWRTASTVVAWEDCIDAIVSEYVGGDGLMSLPAAVREDTHTAARSNQRVFGPLLCLLGGRRLALIDRYRIRTGSRSRWP